MKSSAADVADSVSLTVLRNGYWAAELPLEAVAIIERVSRWPI